MAKNETQKAVSLIDKLIKSAADEEKKILQKIKSLLIEQPYSYPTGESKKSSGYIYESVSVDFIEEDETQPFRFSGVALKADAESKNGRFYPKSVVEKAVEEAKENLDELRLMVGHPKDDETNPMNIVGKFLSIDMDEDGNVPFEAEIANSSIGKDVQELLRGGYLKDLSIRAEGSMVKETVDGRKRDRVTDLHIKGLDFVIEGAIPQAKVSAILSEANGGDKFMTKEELLEKKEVQELIEEAKQSIYEEMEGKLEEKTKKIKELETKLAAEEEAKKKVEEELKKKKLEEFKEKKILEQKVSDKVKELLRKRVSGKDEKEIEEAIKKELGYIQEIAPIFKEGPKVHGIPPKEEEKPKEKYSFTRDRTSKFLLLARFCLPYVDSL